MKLTRAAVAVLSLLLVIGPLTLSSRASIAPCPNVRVRGSWTTIAAPAFTSGGNDLTAYAVHPLSPNVMFASNGEQLFSTQDYGCSWELRFSIDLLPRLDAPVSSANSRIHSIEIPENPAGAQKFYVVVEESVGPAVRPLVLVSSGQDAQFRTVLDGLPLVTGGVYGLHIAPSDPNVMYLQVARSPADATDDLYVSGDAGQTWEERRNDSGARSQGLAIDPLNARDLWTFGANGLWHSLDGGASRTQLNQVGPPVPFLDVSHQPGKPQEIMAYEAETGTFNRSGDGGATWTRFNGPGALGISLARGGNGQEGIVFSQRDRIDRFKPPQFWDHITPDFDQPDLQALSGDRFRFPSVYGMTPRTIEKYSLDTETEVPELVDVVGQEIIDTTSLKPAKTTLKLKAGDSREVQYRFDLPANPTPLDVFFLVDTTDSMDSSIAGLRSGMQRIINALAESKIDVQFGVGEVKDYPVPGYGDPAAGDFPYRLNRAIGPPDESLETALLELQASGGGRLDYEESQLTGLYQATTGEGEPGCAAKVTDEGMPCVPPGQGANFRDGAVPVIVNITDYGFHNQAAHPSPPFDQVVQALNAQDVRQIGLAVYGSQGSDEAIEDLSAMAEATSAVAPAGGVDCDGNGSVDIKQNQPLVCEITDAETSGVLNLAPAIIATVKAVAEEVSVEFVTSEPKSKVVDVAPAAYPSVDITEQNSLGFSLTFSCPRSLAGTTHNLTLATRVSGTPAASATARIVCRKIPAALVAKPKAPPLPPPPPAPVFPPAPVAIPAIAPAGPPPVPETISSTQSAAQAQGAIAKQEQQQVQVAVAYAAFRNDEAYALSAYSAPADAPSPAPLYVSAVAMSLVAAFIALRPRTRLSTHRRSG